jgi:endoglucanase
MINIKLLGEICEAPGAPGHEQRIREVVLREIKPLVDEIKIDNMGNVVAIKKGKKKKKSNDSCSYGRNWIYCYLC